MCNRLEMIGNSVLAEIRTCVSSNSRKYAFMTMESNYVGKLCSSRSDDHSYVNA